MTNETKTSVTEGLATIHITNESSTDVFYNPVQQFNRDVSIAVINQFIEDNKKDEKYHFKEGITILEALSATGLRSIRYAKEVKECKKIVANDFSKRAVESISYNIEANNVDDIVKASHSDAKDLMTQHKSPEARFSVVDLDPYGSPTQFLDGAVQSIADGGLLCVTCTDMAVLCGNATETCYTKYGAISLRGKNCHEMALRIVLQCIESHANRYGRYIVPMLSLSIDFYVRVFVRVYTSQKICKKTTSKLGNVYLCTGCESMTVQPLGQLVTDDKNNVKYILPKGPPVDKKCTYCQHSHIIGGPFWIDPIHDIEFVTRLIASLKNFDSLGTKERMEGMLTMVKEELPDVPFYYTYDRLCALVKVQMSKLSVLRSAFLNAGYKVSLSHANRYAIKTNAPNDVIWDIMRAYEKEHPSRPENWSPVCKAILGRQEAFSDVQVNFQEHPDAEPASRSAKLLRFQHNPPNWGPKTKAKLVQKENGITELEDKRQRNQGKHSKRKNQNQKNENVQKKGKHEEEINN